MEENSTKEQADGTSLFAGEAWLDLIEAGIRERVRGFIQELLEQELTMALGRARHERAEGEPAGCRNGTRERHLPGLFGPVEIGVPRARMGRGRGHPGVAQRHAAALRPDDPAGRGADRRRLPARHQHAPGQARPGCPVRGCRGQGCGEPHLVQGANRLGRLDPARPGRGGRGAPDPRRHRRAGPSGPQGDEHLAAGGAGRAPGRAEGCCWPSRTWAGKARRRGAASWTA